MYSISISPPVDHYATRKLLTNDSRRLIYPSDRKTTHIVSHKTNICIKTKIAITNTIVAK